MNPDYFLGESPPLPPALILDLKAETLLRQHHESFSPIVLYRMVGREGF